MFMQPIEHPALVASRRRRVALKLAVGTVVIATMAIVMPLWWVVTALWLPLTAATRAVRTSYDFALYAGEAVVGH